MFQYIEEMYGGYWVAVNDARYDEPGRGYAPITGWHPGKVYEYGEYFDLVYCSSRHTRGRKT